MSQEQCVAPAYDPSYNYIVGTNVIQAIADNYPLIYDEIAESIERDRMMQDVQTAGEFWSSVDEALAIIPPGQDPFDGPEWPIDREFYAIVDGPYPEVSAKCDLEDVCSLEEKSEYRYLDSDFGSMDD